jgi:hypothetical protein
MTFPVVGDHRFVPGKLSLLVLQPDSVREQPGCRGGPSVRWESNAGCGKDLGKPWTDSQDDRSVRLLLRSSPRSRV